MKTIHLLSCVVLHGFVAPAVPAAGQSPLGGQWLTAGRFTEALAQPTSVNLAGKKLRQALADLSRTSGVATFLDRRVDPGQRVTIKIDDLPLQSALESIAAGRKIGVCVLDPLVIFGPREATARLRTLAELRRRDVAALDAALRRKWMGRRSWPWDDLATPRELIQSLAGQLGAQLTGLDRVPHDLWAAADLPPLALVDRLTLVAASYDLTFTIAPGGAVALVPIPEKLVVVDHYPLGSHRAAVVERWAAAMPGVRIKVVGPRVYVEGRVEDQHRVAARLTGRDTSKPPVKRGGKTTEITTITVTDKPVRAVVEQLAKVLELTIRFQEAEIKRAGLSLDKRVSFKVSAEQDKLADAALRAVLRPAGLTFRRTGSVVEVVPASP